MIKQYNIVCASCNGTGKRAGNYNNLTCWEVTCKACNGSGVVLCTEFHNDFGCIMPDIYKYKLTTDSVSERIKQ